MVAQIGSAEAWPAVFDVVGRPTPAGPTWVWAQTDLDLATVQAARAQLTALLAAVAVPRTVLIYLGVERFVDVRGMRLLVDMARLARARGGELAVVAAPRCLRWMVARFGLDDELFLASSARSAARWARAGW